MIQDSDPLWRENDYTPFGKWFVTYPCLVEYKYNTTFFSYYFQDGWLGIKAEAD